jgi:serine-type D-Ala-D-Ala carboxypeptidase (penicillin-binding protein 5/6)
MYPERAVRRPLLALLALLVLAAPAAASTPQVAARAWLVENAATGEVLLRHNDHARVPIASITKLMTVLVALERTRPTDVVTVSPQAAAVGESSLSLRAGERIAVGDLVEAALIQSANDAAWALAVHAGGGSAERFVGLMNAKARALRLRETRFVRPDGLDVAGHVSSARDVTRLARIAMQHPTIRSVVARRTDTAAGRTLRTWNDLLGRFPGLVGVKTGHTNDAGWSQVAAVRGRGLTLYATILGSPTRGGRNADLAELLEWGLDQYRRVDLVSMRRVYARAETPYGRGSVPLVAERPLRRLVRTGRPVVERIVAPRSADLPVRRGERLGLVRIFVAGKLVGSRPLVAARSVGEPGFFARARWTAGRTLDELGGLFS